MLLKIMRNISNIHYSLMLPVRTPLQGGRGVKMQGNEMQGGKTIFEKLISKRQVGKKTRITGPIC
jgi:hypothetical protein